MKKLLSIFAFSLLLGCNTQEPDSLGLEQSEISIKKGETYQIVVNSKSKVNFTSENDFHAAVDDVGKVTTNYAGETIIKVSNDEMSKEIKVIVEPNFTLFRDPVTDFTLKREAIAKFLKVVDSGYPNPIRNYPGDPIMAELYGFYNTEFLSAAVIMIKREYEEKVYRHIKERYKFELYYTKQDAKYFQNALKDEDATVSLDITTMADSSSIVLTYTPYSKERMDKIKREEPGR